MFYKSALHRAVVLSLAVSHLTSSQLLRPRSRVLSDQGHTECRQGPTAEGVPGKDDPTRCESGTSASPYPRHQSVPVHRLLGCTGDPHTACQNMADSPPECGVLVLISFSHEGRGGRLSNRRQMSLAGCKLGQGGPCQRHRGGSQVNKEAISYGHITEMLGRLHLNDRRELGKLRGRGKPQPRIITPPSLRVGRVSHGLKTRAPSSACGPQARPESQGGKGDRTVGERGQSVRKTKVLGTR